MGGTPWTGPRHFARRTRAPFSSQRTGRTDPHLSPFETFRPSAPPRPVAPEKRESRFAVWGGLLNLQKQVEPL